MIFSYVRRFGGERTKKKPKKLKKEAWRFKTLEQKLNNDNATDS